MVDLDIYYIYIYDITIVDYTKTGGYFYHRCPIFSHWLMKREGLGCCTFLANVIHCWSYHDEKNML